MKRYILLFISSLCVFPTVASGQAGRNQVYQSYIDQYKDMAIEDVLKCGVPASITLAQGLLESGVGCGRLVLLGNDHFGIKCHGWLGRTVSYDDDAKGECFRAYDSVLESFEDHCKLLHDCPRYRSLFSLDRFDHRGWVYGLKRAGYATNPVYAQSLINFIELHKLYEYDKVRSYDCFMAHHSGESSVVRGIENGRPDPVQVLGAHPINKYDDNYYVIVRQGDSLKSLSKELEISVSRLVKYNERDKHERLTPGEHIWLKKKQKKGPEEFKKCLYYVCKSESLCDITQRYGARLKGLVKKNEKIAERGLRIGDEMILC